jgi:orotate phosphoribosyltransferase
MNPNDDLSVRGAVYRTLRAYSVRIAPPGGPLFELRSGEKSRFYIDVRQSAMRAGIHVLLGRMLFEGLKFFGDDVGAVAGVALGGCHLASITGMYSQFVGESLDVLHVRKEPKGHGLKKLVEGPERTLPTRVVLVEDVITTGGSSMRAMEALHQEGYDVLGVLTVIDRRKDVTLYMDAPPGDASRPIRMVQSLFTLKDFE